MGKFMIVGIQCRECKRIKRGDPLQHITQHKIVYLDLKEVAFKELGLLVLDSWAWLHIVEKSCTHQF
jgi:hypothetical protein